MLASIMGVISSTSMASMDSDGAGEAPRPESYASYSLYIQALFNYQKMQGTEKTAASGKPCKNKNDNGPNGPEKVNTCQPESASKIITGEPADNQYESLEDAISKRSPDIRPEYTDTSTHPRSTFSSFPLNPITAQDLRKTSGSGLLGFFNSVVLQSMVNASVDQQLNHDNRPTTNADPRVSNDIASMLYTQIITETLAMGGIIVLRDGSGYVNVASSVVGTGLQLQLSSNVRSGIDFVDRDGYPGSSFNQAGAVVVNSVGINVPNMLVNIQGSNLTSSNPDLIGIQVNSPSAITVDLSGTTVGAADAVRDGSKIGAASTFLSFGPQSVLTISPGMSLKTAISHPNGTTTAFATLNGNIGSIDLQDISLLDNGASVFHIGSLGMDGIQLVNTQIFIDGQKIIIDAGTGINNASLSLERLSLGDGINASMLGDLYVSHINVVNARLSVEAH